MSKYQCSGERAAIEAGREDAPKPRPTVDHSMLLGRMFGLMESRHILTPENFAAAYADIRAEYDAQVEEVRAYYAGERQ